MKKPKLSINFGEGGFQGWLVRHCEKMVLGVILLLALWFIWGGYSLTGLEASKSPEKLLAEAQQKRTEITATKWDNPAFKSREVPRQAAMLVEKSRGSSIDPLPYRPETPLNPSDFPRLSPRTDPEIYAPVKLKTVPLVAALAYVNDRGEADPLDEVPEDGEKRPARRTAAPRPRASAPMPGAGGDMMPGAAGGGRGGGRGKAGPMGNSPTGDGMDLLGEAPSELGGAGMPGDDMMPGGGMQGQGMGGGGGRGEMASSYYQPPQNSIAKTKRGVVLMALVEHSRQWDEFEKKLEESLDHDSVRDQPNYLTFFAQRVDVTDNPDVDPSSIPEEQWKAGQININDSLRDVDKWAGFPQDVLDPNYLMLVDTSVRANQRMGLTHPLPPLVQRDLWEAMTHPDIPLASAANLMPMQNAPEEEGAPGDESGSDIPGVPTAGGGQRIRGGGGMMGGMGGAGMPGMGGGMPGARGAGAAGAMPGMGGAGMGGAGMPGMGGAGMPGMDGAGGMPGAVGGMPGMGGMGGGMGGMGGLGGTNAVFNTPLVKYKLIRFTDFSVEPGRKYRYRVCVVLDDPNNSGLHDAPSPAALDAKVQERLKGGDKDKYYRQSPWSVASDVVTLPPAQWFYVGQVEPEAGQMIVENTRPVRREPSARAVAVVHDASKGADVPTEQVVFRGTTFNLKTEVDVAHPIFGDFRKLKNYVLRTDAVVADILGGEAIPTVHKDRKEKLTVPGEMLIIDAEGNLMVQDESEDVQEFQRYAPSHEEDKPAAAAAGDSGLTSPMGGIPGEDAAPGEVPMGKGRRRNM